MPLESRSTGRMAVRRQFKRPSRRSRPVRGGTRSSLPAGTRGGAIRWSCRSAQLAPCSHPTPGRGPPRIQNNPADECCRLPHSGWLALCDPSPRHPQEGSFLSVRKRAHFYPSATQQETVGREPDAKSSRLSLHAPVARPLATGDVHCFGSRVSCLCPSDQTLPPARCANATRTIRRHPLVDVCRT